MLDDNIQVASQKTVKEVFGSVAASIKATEDELQESECADERNHP